MVEPSPPRVMIKARVIVVHRHVVGLLDEAQQFFAIEHRHTLTRIEYPRDVRLVEFARVLQHAFAPVRRNDPQGNVGGVADMVVLGKTHRAGVERGDLVVIQIGGDERLPGVAAGDMADVRLRNAELLQAQRISGKVVADRRHDQRVAAEQLEVIRDVARAAAELAAHLRHQKRHIQDVNLLGQNVLLELIRKYHDGVVGHRTANQCVHRKTSCQSLKSSKLRTAIILHRAPAANPPENLPNTPGQYPGSETALPPRRRVGLQSRPSIAPEYAMHQLILTRPDDWHLHLRDGALMQSVLPDSARQFARAIVMPNLRPTVTTTEQAQAYRARILAALPAGSALEPLMTLYLTDNTTAQ